MEPQDLDLDQCLKLSIDADQLNATLRIEPGLPEGSLTPELLSGFLAKEGIAHQCILEGEITKLLKAVASDPNGAKELVLAKGKPAVPAQEASIRFTESIGAQIEQIALREKGENIASEPAPIAPGKTDEDQAIDFHNESPFLIVTQGELIGQLTEDAPSKNGFDVKGKSIEPDSNEGVTTLCNDSVTRDSDGNVKATFSGRLIYDSDLLEVQTTLDIPGCVDFSTGNIDFPNDVIIHDGVHDRFCVKAQGEIEIHKLVQASTLISGKDIELKSGMAGREIGSITTGGNLSARYLDGVHATIGCACQVDKEITNCHIIAMGPIDSPATALRGGEIFATQGGVVGSIGSEQGVETDVIIGSLPQIEEKLTLALQLKSQASSSATKQTQELEMFTGSLGKPTDDQAAQIKEMEIEIADLRLKDLTLNQAITRLQQIILTHTSNRFAVKSIIYAKSKLWLPGYRVEFDKDVKGELTIYLDKNLEPTILRNDQAAPLSSVAKVGKDSRVLPFETPKPIEEPQSEADDDISSDEIESDQPGEEASDELNQAA